MPGLNFSVFILCCSASESDKSKSFRRSRSTSRPYSYFNHCIQYSIQRTHALVDFTRSPQTCSSYYSLSQVVKMVVNLFKDQPRHASTTLYISFKNNISINTINSNNRHTIIAAFLEKHTYHRVGSPRGRVFQTTKEEQKDSAESFRTRKAVLLNPARLSFIMHTTILHL